MASRPHSDPPGSGPLPPPEVREKTAHYIAQMASELADMAAYAQLDLLRYFLKMAQMEAEAVFKGKTEGG